MIPFTVEVFGLSERGPVRQNNEDVYCALEKECFYALADGMGGHNAGEVAAQMAVDELCQAIATFPATEDLDALTVLLRTSVLSANRAIYTRSKRDAACCGMGTTLSCCLLRESALLFAHIGDSSLYRLRGSLTRLTEDHSLRHLASKAYRNVLTRALGTQPHVIPEIGRAPLHPGDLYLLCSDGLSDFIPQEQLATILGLDQPLDEIGKKLLHTALKNGSNDNITFLLIRPM